MTQRRTFVIRPPLQTCVEVEGYDSVGDGKPYPKEVRELVIERHLQGLPKVDNDIISLQEQYKYPSSRTIDW